MIMAVVFGVAVIVRHLRSVDHANLPVGTQTEERLVVFEEPTVDSVEFVHACQRRRVAARAVPRHEHARRATTSSRSYVLRDT